MDRIGTAILEEHLGQDRRAVHEHGLDRIGVIASLGYFQEGFSDVPGGSEVVGGLEDIFNRADGLDEVLLDCWMELESG